MPESHDSFKAMIVREIDKDTFVRAIESKPFRELPEGDVLINVRYSSLNYKDALSATGNKGVTRHYPHTPGIDAAGTVETCAGDAFSPGQPVLVTGYDLGMNTSGGFAQYIRVPANWVVSLPDNLSPRESMIYGTAGFTAALSVHKLIENGCSPDQGEVLVTGATGGVGSFAVGILSRLGYTVAALTGKSEEAPYLTRLGAKKIVDRNEFTDTSKRPLLKGLWAGVVDTVGGPVLSTAIRSSQYGATVTCCGNAASPDLDLTVFPFILRGVSLLGIDSVNCPTHLRKALWGKLSNEWKLSNLDDIAVEMSLDELDPAIDRILKGKIKGRTLVKIP